MKKSVLVLIALTTAAMAMAADPYMGLALNYVRLSDAADGDFSPELAIGAKVGKLLRAEGAFTYQKDTLPGLEIKTRSIMGNVYFDFASEGSKMTPYLLGGLGYASVQGETLVATADEGGFVGQVGGGAAIPLAEKVTLDLKYKFQFGQDYSMLGQNFRLTAHVLGVGIRYNF